METTKPTPLTSAARKPTPGPVKAYLFVFNLVSFTLWATCTFRTALLIPFLAPDGHLPAIFEAIYSPLLLVTQSLALLEIVHSLVGFVRAPVTTTGMQVASRILVVWFVMYLFHEGSAYIDAGDGIVGGDYAGVVGKGLAAGAGAKLGDYAFLGCLFAWGVTECIRYGFFAMQLGGVPVPRWWIWLR